ncbi:response regulator transcription factor [Fulvivirgaceae bacterium BMA12]|uniref:Response regulator transcription factor n=1 Tax=Agaribacillus aureus TaxID=3051825 RepID=A0ABT8L6P2_9BACT|nr:response regulator transcription factor [Fulvivirgaceae bacterium BMA12]
MGEIKVLIVEDDPYLGMMMKECFETRQFKATHVLDGNQGFNRYLEWKPDICVLDVMMPVKDGFSLAKEIRSIDKQIPIVFTTAKSLKEDVLEGFDIGADDYLKKPFSMEELIVRVKAILRRSNSALESNTNTSYCIGRYEFDHTYQLLRLGKKEKKLTSMEADLLKYLCDNLNQTLDRKAVLQKLWGDDNFFNARSMDVFITKLRRYLREDTNVEIINVRGKGYKLLVLD